MNYRTQEYSSQDREQGYQAINALLAALWHSEFLGRLHLYRISIVLLADIGLDFGLSHRCKRILEELMPQVSATKKFLLQNADFLYTDH